MFFHFVACFPLGFSHLIFIALSALVLPGHELEAEGLGCYRGRAPRPGLVQQHLGLLRPQGRAAAEGQQDQGGLRPLEPGGGLGPRG